MPPGWRRWRRRARGRRCSPTSYGSTTSSAAGYAWRWTSAPAATGANAADWQPLIGADAVDDFANDGENQLIAGYGQPDHGYESLIPFGVLWTGDRYRLITLTAASTEIPKPAYTGPSAALQSI